MTVPQNHNESPTKEKQESNGCGCLLLLAIFAVLVILVYLASFRNMDFPGAGQVRIGVRETALAIESGTGILPIPESALHYQDTARERERISQPHIRHQDLKIRMLELTNQERIRAGSLPVKLGDNDAAQLHAEAALQGCYSSHWDQWGLKPYMRFTLTGGTGANGENWSGSDYCIMPRTGYASNGPMDEEVADAVERWMGSPGHRRTLLDPVYTTLNIGIAYDRFNTVMAQHFATDYVTFTQLPGIDQSGLLRMKGVVDHRATLDIGRTANVQVVYDPPPRKLTRGQLSHTYSLCNGQRVAYIVEPLPPRRSYTTPEVKTEQHAARCVDPYNTQPEHPAPDSPDAAHQAWADAKKLSAVGTSTRIQIRRVTAEMLDTADGHSFDIRANLSQVIRDHGPGVYTVLLWARPFHLSEPEPISKYSIFWQAQPPADHPYVSLPVPNFSENRPFDDSADRTSHNLIQWEQYPTYDGHSITFRGTLLNRAVLSSETTPQASEGGRYSNFTLGSANEYDSLGSILPPLDKGRSWPLDDPGDTVASEYRLDGREFSITFPFPEALGNPSDFQILVWGFQDEERTPFFGDHIDRLGYARIRVE